MFNIKLMLVLCIERYYRNVIQLDTFHTLNPYLFFFSFTVKFNVRITSSPVLSYSFEIIFDNISQAFPFMSFL